VGDLESREPESCWTIRVANDEVEQQETIIDLRALISVDCYTAAMVMSDRMVACLLARELEGKGCFHGRL
jgi:hypothetical protein